MDAAPLKPTPHIRRTSTPHLAAGIAALLLLLPVAALGYAAVQRFLSPGGGWAVESVIRDPGGMGAPQTIVTLYPAKQKVPTFDDNILIVEGAHTVTAKWESKKAVTITCMECDIENAEFQATRVGDIIITYVTQ